MSYDWHATFVIRGERDADALIGREDAFSEVRDRYGQLRLLSQIQALTSLPDSDWAKERRHYREIVHRTQGPTPYTGDLIASEQRRLRCLGLLRPRLDAGVLGTLPMGSFALQFRFTLQEPFISKDDAPFYPHDNPLRKEWAFKVPMLGGSGWKGNLRAAMRWQNGDQENDDFCLLFGPPRPEGTVPDGYFRAGRLRFYPTHFDALELEMLNPHDRESGSGRDPFSLECVPAGARGVFSLLYVPFDRAGLPWTDYKAEVGHHLQQIAGGLEAMFRTVGFSAKRTSGFGLAKPYVRDFYWGVHALVSRMPPEETQEEAAPKDSDDSLEADIADFVQRMQLEGFPRWTNAELDESDWGRSRTSQYKRLRKRHPDWDREAHTWREPPPPTETAVVSEPEMVPLQEETDRVDLADLDRVADRLAAALREEVLHE